MKIIKIAGIIGLVYGAPMELRKRKTTTTAMPTTTENLSETTFESPVILPIEEDGSGDLIAIPMDIEQRNGYIQNFIDEMQSLKDELKDVDWSTIKNKISTIYI